MDAGPEAREGSVPVDSKPVKVSQPWQNAANKIRDHLLAKWPELQYCADIWFSGSQVWSFLYGQEPPETSDLDIFALKDAPPVISYEGDFLGMARVERTPIGHALHCLGLKPEQGRPKNPVNASQEYSVNGADFTHERGEIDVWTSKGKSVEDVLGMYPGASHAHCRAAFSFRKGLVVLPNECAK